MSNAVRRLLFIANSPSFSSNSRVAPTGELLTADHTPTPHIQVTEYAKDEAAIKTNARNILITGLWLYGCFNDTMVVAGNGRNALNKKSCLSALCYVVF